MTLATSAGVVWVRKCGAAWRNMVVSTAPGATPLTRILRLLPSAASASVNPVSANLLTV